MDTTTQPLCEPASRLTWGKFSRLPYTREAHEVIQSLGLEIPKQYRPSAFLAITPKFFFAVVEQGGQVTEVPQYWLLSIRRLGKPTASRYVSTKELRKEAGKAYLSKGTDTGDAFRFWLTMWGVEL